MLIASVAVSALYRLSDVTPGESMKPWPPGVLNASAQLLSIEKANPYKIRAYRRAASTIRGLGESVDELVRNNGDLKIYAGIGEAISDAIREIVLTGTLSSLEKLRSHAGQELLGISAYPRLDAKRVLRLYKKLYISTIEELRSALTSGQIESSFGARTAQHVRYGLVETEMILLYHAHSLRESVENFRVNKAGVERVEAVGDYRRRVEIINRLDFLIQCRNFAPVVETIKRYGGRTSLVESSATRATYSLAAGPLLCLEQVQKSNFGVALIRTTGSTSHLRKLSRVTGNLTSLENSQSFPSEEVFYKHFDMQFIAPELREGIDEISRSLKGTLPQLITQKDIRGDLHAHTAASDGAAPLEEMARAILAIDKLNAHLSGFRVLKSAEVDILADGALDLPDNILRELDYTVCSIHSRFAMSKQQQTERILRAMDNRYFTILGHATGRLLLKRPGYELDFERIVMHAKSNGCFFELNCSPDRLDVSAENARLIRAASIKIAISTDSHSTGEFRTLRYGLEQARRAGLERTDVLNCQPLGVLLGHFVR